MRLPASTVKLGEKLERYHTAVQVGGALAGALVPEDVVGVIRAPHPRGSAVCVLCSQRSESVKSPGSSRTEFFVTPMGVASKRHLFEKELVGQSRAEPASSRKVRAGAQPGIFSCLGPRWLDPEPWPWPCEKPILAEATADLSFHVCP